MSEVSEVLVLAAHVLRNDGWGQHAVIDLDGRRCAKGALLCAAKKLHSNPAEGGWPTLALRAEAALADHLGCSVAAWNDEPGRTAAEVQDALLAAAGSRS